MQRLLPVTAGLFVLSVPMAAASISGTATASADPNPLFPPVETAAAGPGSSAIAAETHTYGRLTGDASALDFDGGIFSITGRGTVDSQYDDGLFIPFLAGSSGTVRFTFLVTGRQLIPLAGGGPTSNVSRLVANGGVVETGIGAVEPSQYASRPDFHLRHRLLGFGQHQLRRRTGRTTQRPSQARCRWR